MSACSVTEIIAKQFVQRSRTDGILSRSACKTHIFLQGVGKFFSQIALIYNVRAIFSAQDLRPGVSILERDVPLWHFEGALEDMRRTERTPCGPESDFLRVCVAPGTHFRSFVRTIDKTRYRCPRSLPRLIFNDLFVQFQLFAIQKLCIWCKMGGTNQHSTNVGVQFMLK